MWPAEEEETETGSASYLIASPIHWQQSGTDLVYRPTHPLQQSCIYVAYRPTRARGGRVGSGHGGSGGEAAYARAMRCPVPTYCMLLPGVGP
eukprot:2165653-Rhodomonas_salina.3